MNRIVSFIFVATILATATGRAQVTLAPSEHVRKRVEELRERFSRELAVRSTVNDKQADRETTVDALVAIIKSEAVNAGPTALRHQALAELGNYPENNSAIRALLDNIDEPESAAPKFTGSPLEHYVAAQTLIKCGQRARMHILASLVHPQSERKLHMMAYVLAQIDQEANHPFGVDITVLRLTREIKWLADPPQADQEGVETRTKNLQRMIAIMLDPTFSIKPFPSQE